MERTPVFCVVPADCRAGARGIESNTSTKAFKVQSVLGAIDLFLQFIAANSATITARGMTPATITTALNALKTALEQYNCFASLVDFVASGLGKNNNLTKQLCKIRGDVRPTKSTGSGSSASYLGDPGSSS